VSKMAEVPPVRQRPALLAFAEALGSASTALRRDESGDWRIKGKLGFIYAVPGTLDELGVRGSCSTASARPSRHGRGRRSSFPSAPSP
jgi:hypothetical protein